MDSFSPQTPARWQVSVNGRENRYVSPAMLLRNFFLDDSCRLARWVCLPASEASHPSTRGTACGSRRPAVSLRRLRAQRTCGSGLTQGGGDCSDLAGGLLPQAFCRGPLPPAFSLRAVGVTRTSINSGAACQPRESVGVPLSEKSPVGFTNAAIAIHRNSSGVSLRNRSVPFGLRRQLLCDRQRFFGVLGHLDLVILGR